jgi:uncharacterized protein (TIGR03435 family)
VKRASAEEIAAGTSGIPTRPGRVTGINVTLKRCIVGFYHIGPGQVLGGPNWIDIDRFHIEAKSSEPVTDDAILEAMFRNLLTDRFHLALHWATRTLPALVLEKGKREPLLEKAEGVNAVTDAGHGRITLRNSTMDDFAKRLARATEMPVVNETGLDGVYNMKLVWTPDADRPRPDGPPSLPAAIGEQLGLRLVSQKRSVRVLLIDHAEKPGEN